MTDGNARAVLRALFDESIDAVSAQTCLKPHLPTTDFRGRTVIVAAGKAAAEMAAVASTHFEDTIEGLVVYPIGYSVDGARLAPKLEVIEAGHPVPNDNSLKAANRALELARQLGPKDRLISLISGGGSALLACPTQGVTLDDKRAITKALLFSGASIAEMNCVRKHLSQIKGGRLAQIAAPACVHTFLICDIPGDNLALIASGPTLPDTQTRQQAREIVLRYKIAAPPSIWAALDKSVDEAPNPDDPIFRANTAIITACASDAFARAKEVARCESRDVLFLGDALEGPAYELGQAHAKLALAKQQSGAQGFILSGGETTVTLSPATVGRGGRNLEYALALAITLGGAKDIFALACDSDGIDGTSDAAGAIVTPTTLVRAVELGLDPQACLDNHQSHIFFETLGDLVVTGPTRTNINDFRAILIA